jgi:hypothetical protein
LRQGGRSSLDSKIDCGENPGRALAATGATMSASMRGAERHQRLETRPATTTKIFVQWHRGYSLDAVRMLFPVVGVVGDPDGRTLHIPNRFHSLDRSDRGNRVGIDRHGCLLV